MARSGNPAFTGAALLLDGSMRNQIRLAWRLLRDNRVHGVKYLLPALVAMYVASPIDPIPDFLLGIGQIDDLGVVIAAIVLIVRIIPRLAPEAVVSDHLQQMGKVDHAPSASQPMRETRVFETNFSVRS